jgi:hypothetical protein
MTTTESVRPRQQSDDRSRRLVLWPHHPDALLRPGAPQAPPGEAEALAWNVFRSLELMPPAFWLRRLNAALGWHPPVPAPQTAAVSLWRELAGPPSALVRHKPASADILIETEGGLWALLVCAVGDIADAGEEPAADVLAALAAAAARHAGLRECGVGLVVFSRAEAPVACGLVDRYARLPGGLLLRLPVFARAAGGDPRLGLTTWDALVDILRDASRWPALDDVERAIARRTVAWCDGL